MTLNYGGGEGGGDGKGRGKERARRVCTVTCVRPMAMQATGLPFMVKLIRRTVAFAKMTHFPPNARIRLFSSLVSTSFTLDIHK